MPRYGIRSSPAPITGMFLPIAYCPAAVNVAVLNHSEALRFAKSCNSAAALHIQKRGIIRCLRDRRRVASLQDTPVLRSLNRRFSNTAEADKPIPPKRLHRAGISGAEIARRLQIGRTSEQWGSSRPCGFRRNRKSAMQGIVA